MKIDRKKFFDGIRQGPFPGKLKQGQVDGCNLILNEWEKRFGTCVEYEWQQLAYILATVFHETAATMQPIRERGSKKYLRSKKYYPYYGRGYVQLTWKTNYEKYGIAEYPDAALEPSKAVHILFHGMVNGVFTGKKLDDYFNAEKTEWVNARRIINGTDKAKEIAMIAKQFYADILEAL